MIRSNQSKFFDRKTTANVRKLIFGIKISTLRPGNESIYFENENCKQNNRVQMRKSLIVIRAQYSYKNE
jgi:hypothetical protein